MPVSRSSREPNGGVRSNITSRRHRAGFWDTLSSTIRGLFSHDSARNAPRRLADRRPVLEDDTGFSSELTQPTMLHANIPPQPAAPPPALPIPPPVQEVQHTPPHGHVSNENTGAVPAEQAPAVPAFSERPSRPAPLRRHGAFHEHYRPYWNRGSGYEPPIVYGRSPATLPENQVWDPSWGPVPHLSDITALSNGPPTPRQVIDYLNMRFRLDRRAYYLALEILFPQPREAPVVRGIPVYQRIVETSRWRRDQPDWEGGIVPIDREVGPARADDAADSQAGSDDEDGGDGVLTPRERRAVHDRVERSLPDAYRALLAAERIEDTISHPTLSSSPASSSTSGSQTFGSTSTSASSSSSNTGNSSDGSSSSSSSQSPSSSEARQSSPRKRSRDEVDGNDADLDSPLREENPAQRPSTRRRFDTDPSAIPAPDSSSPTSSTRRRSRSDTDAIERRTRRELMRRNRHLLPPIGPPGVRIGAPAPASTSQRHASSPIVDASPVPVLTVDSQPVAGPSRSRRHREVYVEVPPLRVSRKRSRDEDTFETNSAGQDGAERDRDGKRKKKKRSKKD